MTNEKFVAFLYLLGRDHLPLGAIIDIVKTLDYDGDFVFSNKYLVEFATDVVKRLQSKE